MKLVLEDPEEGGILSLKEVKAVNLACSGTLRTPTSEAGPSSLIPYMDKSSQWIKTWKPDQLQARVLQEYSRMQVILIFSSSSSRNTILTPLRHVENSGDLWILWGTLFGWEMLPCWPVGSQCHGLLLLANRMKVGNKSESGGKIQQLGTASLDILWYQLFCLFSFLFPILGVTDGKGLNANNS